ncbi:MAG: ABC transporter ATP-binding protein [Bacteroidetes bacterium]|nr:ABC transporter ATP-binding protein [Bacteroidota bacterium]
MRSHVYLWFARYIKKYWDKELLLFLLIAVSSLGSLASPYILKLIIDDVFPHKDYHLLMKLLSTLIVLYVVRILATYFFDYLFSWLSSKVVGDIRRDLFSHLLHMSLAFYDKNKVGEIVHKINNEVNIIEGTLTRSVIRLCNNVVLLVGLAFLLAWLNLSLFLVSLVVFPFIFVTLRYFTPLIRKSYEKVSEKEGETNNFYTERFNCIRLIKSFNSYDYENEKLNGRIENIRHAKLKNTIYSSLNRNIASFFIAMGPVLIFGWGGSKVLDGSMTLGALVAFLQYINRLYSPSMDMFYLHDELIRAGVSMKQIKAIFDARTERWVQPGSKVIEPVERVLIHGLHFSYEKKKILNGVDLQFVKGRSYALVGASGCGKSTLISILTKFYKHSEGSILYNDNPVNEMSISEWMEYITVVQQHSYILHDTIRENIVYNNRYEGPEDIEPILRQVGIRDIIANMEAGDGTMIGDRGATLSGGQAQRVALARAFLKKSEIVILDEATSALDSQSEEKIIRFVKDMYRDKISIIISHRISAVRQADEIIVLDKGHIIAKGSHDWLAANCEYYVRLFENQMESTYQSVSAIA